jgi:hypothetical protein
MERQWTQDEIDADMEQDDEADVCHHGFGFDETCEWCDEEIAEEIRDEREAKRAAKKPQLDLLKD